MKPALAVLFQLEMATGRTMAQPMTQAFVNEVPARRVWCLSVWAIGTVDQHAQCRPRAKCISKL